VAAVSTGLAAAFCFHISIHYKPPSFSVFLFDTGPRPDQAPSRQPVGVPYNRESLSRAFVPCVFPVEVDGELPLCPTSDAVEGELRLCPGFVDSLASTLYF